MKTLNEHKSELLKLYLNSIVDEMDDETIITILASALGKTTEEIDLLFQRYVIMEDRYNTEFEN